MVGDGPSVHSWRAVAVGRQHFVRGVPGSRGRRHASQTRRGVDVCHPVAGGIWCLDGNPQALAPGGNRAFDWRLYDPKFDVAFVSQTRRIVRHGVCAPAAKLAGEDCLRCRRCADHLGRLGFLELCRSGLLRFPEL